MNDMRKLMEAVELTEYSEDEGVVEELEYVQEQMIDLIDQASRLVSGTSEDGAAQAYWVAHIKTALSNDHEYMGGSMTTMQDTIDALRNGDDDEEDDGSWEAAERANR